MNYKNLRFEIENNIGRIILNRPEAANAITIPLVKELLDIAIKCESGAPVRVLVLQGEGSIFCAGGDLKNMWSKKDDTSSSVPKLGDVEDISLLIRNLNKPVVCKIQGNVLAGALMIVCNATHAIAASNVTFAAPEIKRGIWLFMVMAGLFRLNHEP